MQTLDLVNLPGGGVEGKQGGGALACVQLYCVFGGGGQENAGRQTKKTDEGCNMWWMCG